MNNHAVGYEALALVVLLKAKKQPRCKLWRDFTKTFDMTKRHPGISRVADWVGDWLYFKSDWRERGGN